MTRTYLPHTFRSKIIRSISTLLLLTLLGYLFYHKHSLTWITSWKQHTDLKLDDKSVLPREHGGREIRFLVKFHPFEKGQSQIKGNCTTQSNPHPQTIPKRIHFIFEDEFIPRQYVANIRSFIKYNPSPEWEYFTWTMDTGRKWLDKHYPQVLKLFDISNLKTQVNILRVLIIYHIGGVSFDLLTVCFRPLDRFVEIHACALSREPPEYLVANSLPLKSARVDEAMILCRPCHPFFEMVVSFIEEWSRACLLSHSCSLVSILNDAVSHSMDGNYSASFVPEIMDSYHFNPTFDPTSVSKLQRTCSWYRYLLLDKARKEVCDNLYSSGNNPRVVGEHSFTARQWLQKPNENSTTQGKVEAEQGIRIQNVYGSILGDLLRNYKNKL